MFARVALVLSALFLTACGVQSIPQAKNELDASFAEITNQYKRRSDLIPNLVATVKGYASHEKETLDAVTSARASATQMTVDISNTTPEQMAKWQQAQGQLSAALGRLLSITENYPNLKADTQFRDLQAQLEGTENRITVARNRYIETVKAFNNLVTVPPTSWTNSVFYRFEKAPQWDVSAEERQKIEQAPAVTF